MLRRAKIGSVRPIAAALAAVIVCLPLAYALVPDLVPRAAIIGCGLYAVPAAVGVGMWRHSPPDARAWCLYAVGLTVIATGIWSWFVAPLVHAPVTTPSITDLLLLAGYGLVAIAVERLARHRSAEGMRAVRLDALIIAVAVGVAVWVLEIDPVLEASTRSVGSLVVLGLYPVIDVAILASLAHLLSARTRSATITLLAVAALASLVAHLGLLVEQTSNTYLPGQLTDIGWCVALMCFGAAALHPNMAAPSSLERGPSRSREMGPLRLVALAAAVCVIPTFLLAGPAIHLEFDDRDLGIGGILLGLLVVLRLADTIRRLTASLRRRVALQDELSAQATHDALTGLANRAEFIRRTARALEIDPGHVAVLILDVDDFKSVNDSHGHPVGDAVLEAVGRRIEATVRAGNLVARLGGDEFAVLIENAAPEASADELAQRLLATLNDPLVVADHLLYAHASIGVALGRDDPLVDNLIRDADVAMYQAKDHGKSRFEAFDPTMHAVVLRRMAIRAELEAAISNGEFVLYYQPIVTFCKRTVYACEALVRWQHPDRGLVSPDEFIGPAEDTGLIVPLGRWVLREACHEAARWVAALASGPTGIPAVSVNVSAVQFRDSGFVADVSAAVADAGIEPGRLVLELTERSLVDCENAAAILGELRAIGVKIALDDFGTGYSSLAYLTRYPIDTLKIDRAFVSALGSGAREDRLTKAIVNLGLDLRIQVIAEGVETEEQRERLFLLGCGWFQGFLVARPMPVADLEMMLRNWPWQLVFEAAA